MKHYYYSFMVLNETSNVSTVFEMLRTRAVLCPFSSESQALKSLAKVGQFVAALSIHHYSLTPTPVHVQAAVMLMAFLHHSLPVMGLLQQNQALQSLHN